MITQAPLAFLMGQTPMQLFVHGGPIMWPILLVSFFAVTIVIERCIFIFREAASRQPEVVEKMLDYVEKNNNQAAVDAGKKSKDFVVRILTEVLTHGNESRANVFARAANNELTRFQQGMVALETCITAAPLLGLLGTVTGMMNTFGALGSGDIAASASKITGGVGEALIATMCGLAVAILSLFPYNILTARVETAKHDMADAANSLEVTLNKKNGN
jgi:biopolymer transport protein ExbB